MPEVPEEPRGPPGILREYGGARLMAAWVPGRSLDESQAHHTRGRRRRVNKQPTVSGPGDLLGMRYGCTLSKWPSPQQPYEVSISSTPPGDPFVAMKKTKNFRPHGLNVVAVMGLRAIEFLIETSRPV